MMLELACFSDIMMTAMKNGGHHYGKGSISHRCIKRNRKDGRTETQICRIQGLRCYKANGAHEGFGEGCMPITIPKHEPIKKAYVEMVRQIVESEAKNDEDTE